jgi:hypothetical protein
MSARKLHSFSTHTMDNPYLLPLFGWKYRKKEIYITYIIIIPPHLYKEEKREMYSHFFLPIILDILRTNPFFGFAAAAAAAELVLLITGVLAECDRV